MTTLADTYDETAALVSHAWLREHGRHCRTRWQYILPRDVRYYYYGHLGEMPVAYIGNNLPENGVIYLPFGKIVYLSSFREMKGRDRSVEKYAKHFDLMGWVLNVEETPGQNGQPPGRTLYATDGEHYIAARNQRLGGLEHHLAMMGRRIWIEWVRKELGLGTAPSASEVRGVPTLLAA